MNQMSLHAVRIAALQMLTAEVIAVALDKRKESEDTALSLKINSEKVSGDPTQWKWICSKMNFSFRGPPMM